MDYWEKCDVRRWTSLAELRAAAEGARFFFLTSKAQRPYWDAEFRDGDHLVFGRETRGLPESLLAAERNHLRTIPMAPEARSLNLATSVGIVLYEACRQLRGR
jgi:tRNA (cytidine/uridine-2'-O-)-methyltransferase